MSTTADPTTWIAFGTGFPHADWRMGTAVVVNGAVICASGYYIPGTGYYATKEVLMASAEAPSSWVTLTAMPNATFGAAKFVIGNKLYIVDGASLVSYTVPSASIPAGTSGVVKLATVDLTYVRPITDVIVHASIPVNTAVIPAISFDDGITWNYWNASGMTWTAAASQAAAFASGTPVTLVAGTTTQYRVPGLTNFDPGSNQTLTLAFRLGCIVANVTPSVMSVQIQYASAMNLVPMITGGMSSTKAEVGLQFIPYGPVSSVQVKNLTAAALSLRLKVQG
jgi:hypothetical protein